MHWVRRSLVGTLALLATGTVATAAAQDGGPGLVAANLRLAPSLTLGLGYDSNVFYESEAESPVSALRLDITPALAISTVAVRSVDFGLNVQAQWRQFLNYSEEDAADQSRLDVDASVGARFNPNGFVSVRPANEFRLTNETAFSDAGDPFQVLHNNASLEVGFHPGGSARSSRLGFSGTIVGSYRLWDYDQFDNLDRDSFGAFGEMKWNFLPKTALFLNAGLATLRYAEEADGTNPFANSDGLPYSVSAGLSGLLATRFGLLARIGYSDTNRDVGASTGSVIGQLEGTVYLSQSAKTSLGYRYDVADAAFGNFTTYHRIYGSLSATSRVVNAELTAFYQMSEYGELSPQAQAVIQSDVSQRKDDLVGAGVSLGFPLGRYFELGAAYDVRTRASNLSDAADSNALSSFDVDYLRHFASLTATVRY